MYSLKIDDKTKQDLAKYQKDEETSCEMSFLDVLDQNKFRLKLVLDLEALAPIYSGEYGQSVLCKFLNNEQYAKLASVEDLVGDLGGDFDVKPLLQDETFFLKLQTKDGKYKAQFDVPVDANEPEKVPIVAGTTLVVFCKPGVWLNYKTNKAGVYLQVEKINLAQEAPKKKNRVKK